MTLNHPMGPSPDYGRGASYAEIYLQDDRHRSPEQVEALRSSIAAHNVQELHIPDILACFAESDRPDHPTVVDPTDDFWHGFVDRVDEEEQKQRS